MLNQTPQGHSIDVGATLRRLDTKERTRFEEVCANYNADRAAHWCRDEDQAQRKALCVAVGLQAISELFWSLDPTLNPVGVEAAMRLRHPTLNALSPHQMRHEVALAAAAERSESGYLRRCANADTAHDDGWDEYLQGEKLVQHSAS